jgi:hypothetical protein
VTRDRARTLALAASLAVAAAACGGTSAVTPDAGPGSDGAVGDGRAGDAPTDTGALGCDPVAQSCGPGQKCDFGCAGTTAVVACWPGADGGVVGSLCSAAMPCGRGTGCIATAANAGAAACRKYCASDGDCATGERCHNDSVGVACGAPATSLALHFCY